VRSATLLTVAVRVVPPVSQADDDDAIGGDVEMYDGDAAAEV
jgi:hypothetical protein